MVIGCGVRFSNGPSPRRRGNRSGLPPAPARRRPIPAQAGEPARGGEDGWEARAHPRAGGGTIVASAATQEPDGPSPRRRGNPPARSWSARSRGPIPAQAGEPWKSALMGVMGAAHPRAGGGTRSRMRVKGRKQGPSPRRRGNLFRDRCHRHQVGPIPAQAGEPCGCRRSGLPGAAHPRAGGGTACSWWISREAPGPSPRRRGNPGLRAGLVEDRRPIPAQAGEPSSRTSSPCGWQAHPRAGGGTTSPRSGCGRS